MPVHAVAGGFRWGTTGKVYRTRAAAERQARAIYASGWREDSRRLHRIAITDDGPRGRFARRKMAQLLRAARDAETSYVLDLVRAFQAMHRATMRHVGRIIQAPELRQDEEREPLRDEFFDRLLQYLTRSVSFAFDKMVALLEKKSARTHTLLGISPASIGLTQLVARARDRSIALVERAGRAYAADVRRVIGDAQRFGQRPEELADALVERGNVSVSRATLIARDQTLKVNSAITRARHEAAGITEYRWSGVLDERERPRHRELEGERFAYDDPPVTNEAGDRNNPGGDYQCRCVPIPVIPAFEEAVEEPLAVAAEE